jgi:pimeloyl-ACP methyl ester carboxylesterase
MDRLAGRRWFRHFYAGYRIRERPELIAELSHIQCPTAVIWGDEDAWCPISIAQDLVEKIDSAVLTQCPGTGHFVTEAAAPAVSAALEMLLNREPSDGR